MSVIVIRGLTKRFGRVTAVSDLSFEVAAGEVVGFLGPNGAGKTTTIRTLLGFLRPSAGDCTVLGGWPAREVGLRRRIGYLPGDLRIEPAMTGSQLFAWFGRLRGGLDRARVDELVQRLALDPSRPFRALSKGNRQKVGIVQAFCHRPEVLVLDEPTSGLDPLVQREFLTLVQEAAAAGAAVLFSSHVLPEVERAAHRVAIIRQGRLVTLATVDGLLDQARHRLELRFADPVSAGLSALLERAPGVVEADVDGPTATIVVDGPVGPALRVATGDADLLRIRNVGDDLEDLFVSIYQPAEQAMEVG